MAAAGLPLDGVLVALFGWRSVFLVNVPLALLALALTAAFVPRALDRPAPDAAGPGAAPAAPPRLDPVGIGLFGALCGMLYAGAQWLGAAQSLAAAAVGLAMLPQSLLSALSSVAVRRSLRVRALLLGAAGATALAGVAALVAAASSSVLLASVAGGLLGTAMGIGGVGNQAALYRASPAGQLGVSAGLLRTSSYVGGFVTSGVMAAVYADGAQVRGAVVGGPSRH